MESNDRRYSFGVEGMTCASCVRIVENQLKKVPGVEIASVNLATGKAYVVSSPSVTFDILGKAVNDAGYKPLKEAPTEDIIELKFRRSRKDLIVAAAITIPVMVLMIIHMAGVHLPWFLPVELAAGLLVLLWPGRGTLKGASIALLHRHANMDTLVSLGAVSAWLTAPLAMAGLEIKSFGALSAMLIAFHLTGRYIEARLKSSAGREMRALMAMQIKEALVISDDGNRAALPIEAVKPGMRILVRTGERIPLDGRAAQGSGAVDESMINGEPIPRMIKEGDPVIGGTVLETGSLEVMVEQPTQEGYLSRMIKLIEEAQSSRVPIQAMADRVAAVFIPVVFSAALISALVWYFFFPQLSGFLDWASTFIPWVSVTDPASTAVFVFVATLVIACPCALGLATPMALVTGSSAAAKRGILIKSGEAIQQAGEIDVIFLDKTGTVTEGHPRVTRFTGNNEALLAAAKLEGDSLHPLGRAVTDYAQGKLEDSKALINDIEIRDFKETAGEGISGRIENNNWHIGRPNNPDNYIGEMNDGGTVIEIMKNFESAGVFIINDPIKADASLMVEELKLRKITPIMLTGDGERTAWAVASKVGIKQVHASVMPHEKLAILQEKQKIGLITSMVGDGINDAAALKAAEVGFAMGTGTDLSMESGDIILHGGDISKIIESIDLSKLIYKTIRQNLFWAFLYNALAIPLALSGLLHPALAEIAMTLSSINVISNSLRIGKKNTNPKNEESKEKIMEYNFNVPEMSCGHCKMRIEKVLTELNVSEIEVNLDEKTVKAVSDKAASELMTAMEDAGYPATEV